MSALCWTLKETLMVFAIAFCGLASMLPNRAVVFLFFALCFSESVLNGVFHVGATVFSGVYCLGLICSSVVSPAVLVPQPGCSLRGPVDQYAWRGGVFLIAEVIHTVDVATSVFGVKLRSHRLTT